MSSLSRFCGALAATLLLGLTFSAFQPVQAQTPTPTPVIISEFRFRGVDTDGAASTTSGAANEFIEIMNNSDAAITVPAGGWTVRRTNTSGTLSLQFTIPAGTVIPPRGHFLWVNSAAVNGFSLGNYPAANGTTVGTGDVANTNGIVDGGGIALFSSATTFDATTRLDAVGFAPAGTTTPDPLYREGTGLLPAGGVTTDGEYSFVRKMPNGVAQDTNDNQADFDFVSTNGGTYSGRVSVLGAPGPERLSSPVQRNAAIKASLINSTVPGTSSPNRVRSGQVVTNGQYGTLSIQRKFTNTTPDPITRLRFRVVDITTLNSPLVTAPQADLRVLSSSGTVTNSDNQPVASVTGLTLEEPPTQPLGGGLNSSLTVIPPNGSLASGSSIEVQFLLGVQQEGNFRFLVNVEALPATSSAPSPALTDTNGATKTRLTSKARAAGNK